MSAAKATDTQNFDRCMLPSEMVREHSEMFGSINMALQNFVKAQDELKIELNKKLDKLEEGQGKIYDRINAHSDRITSAEGEVQRLKEDKKALFAIFGTCGTILFELGSKLMGGR